MITNKETLRSYQPFIDIDFKLAGIRHIIERAQGSPKEIVQAADGSQSRRSTSHLSRTRMDSNTSFEPTTAPHPGETVQDYLDFYGWSQRDLARRTGLTPKTISEICNGKGPITPPTALAFEKAFQRPAHLWLNLQRQYDELEARRREEAKATGQHTKLFGLY